MDIAKIFRVRNNTIDTVAKVLHLSGVNVTHTTLARELEEHPDYPSLLSISDVLTSFGVQNISLKTSPEQLLQMPMPCITPIRTNKHEEKFTVISSATQGFVTFLNPESRKFENIPADAFAAKWHSGILMLVDAEGAKGEADYPTKRRQERRNDLFKFAVYAVLPAFILFVSAWTMFSTGRVVVAPVAYILLMLAGLVTSALLIWYKIDEHNPALKQICKGGAKVLMTGIWLTKKTMIGLPKNIQ